jgi:hypothetical protein
MRRRTPADYLALATAGSMVLVGVALMAGLLAPPTAEPRVRLVFGGVLVLYGLYRFAAQSARNRADDDDR